MTIPATKSAVIARMRDPAITLVMNGSVDISRAMSRSYSSSSSAIPSCLRLMFDIFLFGTSLSLIFLAVLLASRNVVSREIMGVLGAKASLTPKDAIEIATASNNNGSFILCVYCRKFY